MYSHKAISHWCLWTSEKLQIYKALHPCENICFMILIYLFLNDIINAGKKLTLLHHMSMHSELHLNLFQIALVLYHLTSVGTCSANWNIFDLFNISIT